MQTQPQIILGREEQYIGIQRISIGKTNTDKVLYGRVMRHKEPELWSIGILALYLLARFELTDEIEHMNFDENKTWFNKKLLKSMVVSRGNDKGKT